MNGKTEELRKENRRKAAVRCMSGQAAAALGAGRNPAVRTGEGLLILPADGAGGGTAAMKDDFSREIPEFYPADPEEAFRMARAACLYADTYRTPILVRLAYEVRFGMAEISPLRESASEKRRGDYRHESSPAGLPQAFSDSSWNRISGGGRKGIVVRGPAWLKLLELLDGYSGVRVMKLGTPCPFPEERIRDFLAGLSDVLVLDEERGRLLTSVYAVKGKYDLRVQVRPFFGEENSERDLRDAAAEFLGKDAAERLLRIGVPPERSLFGMPYLPPVSCPGEPLFRERGIGGCV